MSKSNGHEPVVHKPLTHKQQRFVDLVQVDGNATQAALGAGYSPKTAAEMGAENLKKPHIQAALSEKRRALCEKIEHSQEKLLRSIADIAYDESRTEGYRLKAMEMLCKCEGMFIEKREVRTGSLPDGDPGLQGTMDLLEELAAQRDQAALPESL